MGAGTISRRVFGRSRKPPAGMDKRPVSPSNRFSCDSPDAVHKPATFIVSVVGQSSSVVEQRTHKPLVGGSIPPSGTNRRWWPRAFRHWRIPLILKSWHTIDGTDDQERAYSL